MRKRKWLVVMVVIGVLVSILATNSVLAHGPNSTEEGSWELNGNCWDCQDRNRGWGMHGFHIGFFSNETEGRFSSEVPEEDEYCFGYQEETRACHMHGFHFGIGGHIVIEEVAGILGLTPEDLIIQLDEGQTIEQIASAQGIAMEELIDEVVTLYTKSLATLVEEGYINQEQADALLEQEQSRIEQLVTTLWLGVGYGHVCGYCAPSNTTVKPNGTADLSPQRDFSRRGCR